MSTPASQPAAALRDLAQALLAKVGAPAGHASLVAETLVDADIEGLGSHGLMLLPMYLERIEKGSVDAAATGEIVVDAGARVTIDAANALGQVTAERASELAIERARRAWPRRRRRPQCLPFWCTAGRYARKMAALRPDRHRHGQYASADCPRTGGAEPRRRQQPARHRRADSDAASAPEARPRA
jgi:hypothetical protein